MRGSVVVISRQGARSSEPSGIAPHNFYDSDAFYRVNKRIVCNFQHCGCNVFGGRTESGCVVDHA